jgi:hypothetical protein
VAVRPSSPATPAAPEHPTVWVTREILAYQQFFGSPELKERGLKLFEAARWRLEPKGALTFEPREKPGAFFPITVPVTRDGTRVSFAGSRVARASDGLAYVHIAGRFVSAGNAPELNVELEIGRASGADGADHDPTYRARARLRLSAP